jgi:hypothetical protein
LHRAHLKTLKRKEKTVSTTYRCKPPANTCIYILYFNILIFCDAIMRHHLVWKSI